MLDFIDWSQDKSSVFFVAIVSDINSIGLFELLQ